MKNCIWCGQLIADQAKKCYHCQSFLYPNDAPKPGSEIATLVISFVGVMAIIGTIVAGVVSYIGFKSINDTNERINQISDRASTLLTTTTGKLASFDKEMQQRSDEYKKLTEQVENTSNLLFVRQAYAHFNALMNDLRSDELHRVPDVVSQLEELRNTMDSALKIPEVAKEMATEISVIVKCINPYGNGKYQEVIDILTTSSLSDRSLHKHRLLGNAYKALHNKAKSEGKSAEAEQLLKKSRTHYETHHSLSICANKSITISKVNLAVSLLSSTAKEDLEKARSLLLDARRESPHISTIYYNLAA